MSNFVKKASAKIDKLSDEQIRRVFSAQEKELELRNDILDTVDAGFAVIKQDCRLLYVNSYLAGLLQFDINAFTPKKTLLRDIILDQNFNSEISDFIKNGEDSFEKTIAFNHSILGEIKIHIRAFSCRDCYVLTFRDITLLDKFRVEFQKNESLASMTTMAAGIAHEIKNPLASMSIYLQLLNKKLDKDGSIKKEDAQKSLSIIGDEIERLNSMAVDFLFAVKPINIDMKIISINEVVNKTVSLISAEVEDAKISLILNLGTSIPNVSIDENLFEQCILNLVRNSIQAMPKRKKDGMIEISTYLDGDYVFFSIVDNGCGMDDTQLTRIFEPYYTTKANGTGLGLTTIFKIVKGHGGEINVSSHVDEGSVFTIKLPVPPTERFRIK